MEVSSDGAVVSDGVGVCVSGWCSAAMKLKCRLCELTTMTGGGPGPKLGGVIAAGACTHTAPDVSALGSLYHFAGFMPQLRDMMLAACLFRGYYQPAGPLITAHHGHAHQAPTSGKTAAPPLPTLEASPSPTPPPSTTAHQPPPSSTGTADSSDNEVIITSTSSGSEPVAVPLPPAAQPYRYAQYGGGAHGPPAYGYSYPPPAQYYHGAAPPPAAAAAAAAAAAFAQQQHYHHDLCYPGTSYPASYLHPKAYATTFRRYLPPPPAAHQYYSNPDLYSAPAASSQSSQVVSAASGAGGASSYQTTGAAPPPGGPPPPPPLVDSYAAPPPPPVPPTIVETYPPPHYYAGYSAAAAAAAAGPACYSHSPPTRNITFIDPAYQSCPCPMQSCPKNVHTGPLTGDGKRSNVTAIAKESMPLPPVALALPLEPASVAGPPSPARGSAGMPPPPSPAGATYQPTPAPPPTWEATKHPPAETVLECKPATTVATVAVAATVEKRRPARVGKTMARNKLAGQFMGTQPPPTQGMLLMCHNPPAQSQPPEVAVSAVKREVESPQEVAPVTVPVVAPPPPQPPEAPPSESAPLSPPPTLADLDPKVQTISDECSERLNSDETSVEALKSEEVVPSDENIPAPASPACQPSLVEDTALPQTHADDVPEPSTVVTDQSDTTATDNPSPVAIAAPEPELPAAAKPALKRKLSADDTQADVIEYKVQAKKQKTNSKCKVPNGSYKDLIKKSNKCIKINNGKRKLNVEYEANAVETKFPIFKTPKIALGAKARKSSKRKANSSSKEEQPASKRVKASRPLVASNLHNSKQNVKSKEKAAATVADATENKEPARKGSGKKITATVTVAASTTNNNTTTTTTATTKLPITNVDRTIESVVMNHVEEPVRTATSASSSDACRTVGRPTDPARGVRKIGSGRSGTSKKRSKAAVALALTVPRKSLHIPRWSNGWSWQGEPFQGKIFLNSDEAVVARKCYPAMRHAEGDVIVPRDCVLLKSGPRKTDLPFVAKVAALWENPEDGEMMMSLLWYYRPEHTEQGRRPIDQPDEVFASRHKDTNSVACIEDKCYVLTFNEYCRYRKTVRRLEEGIEESGQVVPLPDGGVYHRLNRQPQAPLTTSSDLVFFCRQVYDFRQKRLVKNPS